MTGERIDADGYAESIFNDLLPAVERRYRVQANRAHRAVAGGSLARHVFYGRNHRKARVPV